MKEKRKCIMLIDDNPDDNFFHEREIKKTKLVDSVIVMNTGAKALEYLKANADEDIHPCLIFLDINMPGMNGWEFLEEYDKLDKELQSQGIVIMLTTSENPEEVSRAKSWNFVADYITKPLTKDLMIDALKKYLDEQST
jgi:CheY-like chemotaxis protein